MRKKILASTMGVLASTALVTSSLAQDTAEEWTALGQSWVRQSVELKQGVSQNKAKKIILFVGDGMGVSTVTAARIREGQLMGLDGEEHYLSFETMPNVALSKVYNVNSQVPDSAGTMTAMVHGIKTDVGVIGVNQNIVRGDCSTVAGNETTSLLESAEMAGWATGVVSTARLTHATPAATYAHSADRNWEDISDMPQAAIDEGCEDIASQLVNLPYGDGIEVAMGGGRRHFLPKDAAYNSPEVIAPKIEGDRTDDRDLTAEWVENFDNAAYIWNRDQLLDIEPGDVDHLLALFEESHMEYEHDRPADIGGEPSIAEMTGKAIDLLNEHDNWFLHVESGRIDHAHHATNPFRALDDTIAFAHAIQVAMEKADDETLIIVTADHSHVFTIGGYTKRGNPILGKVVPVGGTEPALASDGWPYTTLGYNNGRGFRFFENSTSADNIYDVPAFGSGRVDLTGVNTNEPGFHPEVLVPLSSETHSGEDVAIYAMGAGAENVRGVMEQSFIYHVMVEAASADLRNVIYGNGGGNGKAKGTNK